MVDIQKALEFQSQEKFDEAEKIYLEFLKIEPEQPDVSNLLGMVYLCTNKFSLAQQYFEFAVKGFPCAEYYQNLGISYYKQKKYEQAMQFFEKAIEYEPQNVDFIRKFAKLAKDAKQIDYAINFYKKSLDIIYNDQIGWNNIGLLYEQKHDYKSAKNAYVKSLKIKKNYEALHNLGVLYRTERNYNESINCLKEALKLNPKAEKSLLAIGMSYLSKKDFKNGYKYYTTKKPEVQNLYKNHWDGSEHKDKTLLVYYDSGFGDQIMFCRYLNLVKPFFKNIKFLTHSSLYRLFKDNFKDIEIVLNNNKTYDYSDNIMYLNYHLDMDFGHIPNSNGYLKAEKSNNTKFNTSKTKIGLFWQGNYDGYKNRAIALKELAPLLSIPNTQYYGFVKEDKLNQIKEYPQIIDLSSDINDFYDTASMLLNLDLFITIDTAAANLAGALGIKTYLLLPYASEWRWFDDTETTPWYDSVTIFKQTENWIWQDVVERLYDKLKNLN